MKKLLIVTLLLTCIGAGAQSTSNSNSASNASGVGNNQTANVGASTSGSSSTSNALGTGNSQSITFTSPPTSSSYVEYGGGTTNSSTTTSNNNSTSTNTSTSNSTSTDNVNYSGTQTIKNVPTVIGPNLTSSNDTCMGSTSGGVAGPGFGVTVGSTWTDTDCKRLKMSRELWNKGMKAASLAIDCMNPEAREALEITGTKCPQSMTEEERVKAYGPQASAKGAAPERVAVTPVTPAPSPVVTPVKETEPVAATPTPPTPVQESTVQPADPAAASIVTDPYIRARKGLPPL